jgi:SAM-dependent methyltransferase
MLRTDGGDSLRSWAIWSARYHWTPWGSLLESVRAGASSRPLSGTGSGYAHLEADPRAAATFNGAMAEISRLVAAPLNRVCDLSSATRIVDVGGGSGELLVAILASQPKLRGVLLDLAHAVDAARARIDRSGLAARCEIIAGSFFDAIPPGCDVHLLKAILHNWDDERCRAILRQCRASMPAGGRLLLVERVVPPTPAPQPDAQRIARSDLNMLVSHAGRERTLAEYGELLDRSGFRLGTCTPLRLGFSVLEAHPSGARAA